MPAYNAEKTVKKTVDDLPKDLISEVILVDDASRDKTVQRAKKMGITVYTHKENKGYGANQKTCYDQALKRKPDIVVMVHPDYQYDAKLVGVLCESIVNGRADVMLGSRIQTRRQVLAGGMPLWKYFANRFLTLVENLAMGLNLSEYHTGFRAYSSKVLRTIPYQKFSNDFIFDQQILISALSFGFNISEIPVPCKYFPEASTINLQRSLKYGVMTIWTVLIYLLYELGIIRSSLFKSNW
ncbi:MAG: Glycosyl transferase, group 2 family protein [Candidatus Curtissbacteria bacterium GW2011_GWC2_38_9]|uniref:Glycosyl transferase family 2 n=3 Tax=Candidatus Curtissiibacteriota TaxID=1752717 RepID=A0A1F5HPP8_9BACT|nr:MAG: Glycosyl transferase, group 2 family protein [Candidatus Curtissbacteria bacterium GW2011_GWC2_38_9]KKS04130.1 MAG: Glycosyl transferase, group 2 family protein [Candidatus Curtissbacteria bacterium GW2011_GWA2_41_24]OGD88840.1 MAG: glycosyl transferase family 2 [Candidatus Curtissbacteria bacterium RIFCSPHIGHO2_02_39_8]OGE06137.1 MAG: glycosyl transferase family 2 [Candidatus Curtissbacteria bacterium RIFCSPLOWO2_02_41_11]